MKIYSCEWACLQYLFCFSSDIPKVRLAQGPTQSKGAVHSEEPRTAHSLSSYLLAWVWEMKRRKGLHQIICLRCFLELGLYFHSESQLCNVLTYAFYFLPFHWVSQRFQGNMSVCNLPHPTILIPLYNFFPFQMNTYPIAAFLPFITENQSPEVRAKVPATRKEIHITNEYIKIINHPLAMYQWLSTLILHYFFMAFTTVWNSIFLFICFIMYLFPLM